MGFKIISQLFVTSANFSDLKFSFVIIYNPIFIIHKYIGCKQYIQLIFT